MFYHYRTFSWQHCPSVFSRLLNQDTSDTATSNLWRSFLFIGPSCWSIGHPCSIQRGLARRLRILLVCTDPLFALAPELQEVMVPDIIKNENFFMARGFASLLLSL